MRSKIRKTWNCILILGVLAVMVCLVEDGVMTAQATPTSELQNEIEDTRNEIEDTKNQIEDINNRIDNLTDEQDLAEEMIADLNAEIINTMTSIGMKEDEIAEKETQLTDKQEEIEITQQEYEAAKQREEEQYAAMIVRIRDMYERGTDNYLNQFLMGDGLGGILNRMDFVEKIYEYDRQKVAEYEETKNQVHDLWDRLETEKAQLETDKQQLEADRAALEEQKENLDVMLAQKKQESANYEAEINRAKQEAAIAKELLQQEEAKLQQLAQQLQAQQNQSKPGNSAATNGNYTTTDYTSVIEDADGSEAGKNVAKYACQFIGNPYVYGGTSLTNGADCSGFTYRVYKDFGYTISRTSYGQRSEGTEVSYSDAQPGDLICYDGHVGIYIGGGKIVHASTARTGIKVSNAQYRTIVSVRRIL